MRSYINRLSLSLIIIIFLFISSYAKIKELSQEDMLSILVLELKEELENNGMNDALKFDGISGVDYKKQLEESMSTLNRSLSSTAIRNSELIKIRDLIRTINTMIKPESILSTIQAISKNTGGNRFHDGKRLFQEFSESHVQTAFPEWKSEIDIEQVAPVFKDIVEPDDRSKDLNILNIEELSGKSLTVKDDEEDLNFTSMIDIKGRDVNLCFAGNIKDGMEMPSSSGDFISFYNKDNIILPSSAALGGGLSFSENAFYILSGDFVFDLIRVSDKYIKIKIFPHFREPAVYGIKFYPEKNDLTKIFRIDSRLIEKDRLFISYIIEIDNSSVKDILKNIFKNRLRLKNVPDFENTADSFLANESLLSLIELEDMFQKERGLDPTVRRVSREDISGNIIPDFGLNARLENIKIKNGNIVARLSFSDQNNNSRKVPFTSSVDKRQSGGGLGAYREQDISAAAFFRTEEENLILSQKYIYDKNCLKDEMKNDVYNIIASVSTTPVIKKLLYINDAYDVLSGYRLRQEILYSLSEDVFEAEGLKKKVRSFFAELSKYLERLSVDEKKELQKNIRPLLEIIIKNNGEKTYSYIKELLSDDPDQNILIFLQEIGVLKRVAVNIRLDAKGIKPVQIREKNLSSYVDVYQILSLFRYF